MSSSSKDYYAVLGISPDASLEEIRKAYQRAALATHPDRQGNTRQANARFQLVADAYTTLSDPVKRAAYDRGRSSSSSPGPEGPQPDAEHVFEDVFGDMLRPEGARSVNAGWFWWLIGTIAGILMGFIIFNIPGSMAGAYIGGQIGAIRDRQGKPVAHVFRDMPSDQRYAILQQLAMRFLTSQTGGM
ncbi:MAG: DnaJ domain-containing protein [Piptocephalis tieghemiana]|nr:MAG: DnaJ domain-containing protein [Piptocephalis tieghemiana]